MGREEERRDGGGEGSGKKEGILKWDREEDKWAKRRK